MKSDQTQTPKTNTTAPLSKKTTSHINPESKSEPMTKVQADNVITREDLPNVGFRITVTIVILALFLFFVATYYGILNL